MRTLKFRVYNYTRNEMTYDIESIDFGKGAITQVNTLQDRILFPDKECDIMQWTGLTDRHGKEIYEGDIVRCTRNRHKLDQTGEVVWGNHRYEVKGFYQSSFDDPTDAFSEATMEIIGNIYENPEMLK